MKKDHKELVLRLLEMNNKKIKMKYKMNKIIHYLIYLSPKNLAVMNPKHSGKNQYLIWREL